MAHSVEIYKEGDVSLNASFWGQAWYQSVSDFDRDGDARWDDDVHDFMMRRAYFSLGGTLTRRLSFFVHYAGDRIGQEGLDNSGLGLGSGLALRDGWVAYSLIGDDLMVQMGRMYVPLTRNYGTTSTRSMLTTDLDWGQGGLRSGIFYPQKVGRDDSVAIWGNVLDDRLQYRLMIGEGAEGSTVNPDDELRVVGRISLSLYDRETSWFNAGTYLGRKKILAVGAGFDHQPDLVLGGQRRDYRVHTVDLYLDLPFRSYVLTAEFAYIWIENVVNAITWSALAAGTDGDVLSTKAGVLLGDRIQPFAHYQSVMPDAAGANDTDVFGVGCNYYLRGHANKLTLEYSQADDGAHAIDMITFQAAFGL